MGTIESKPWRKAPKKAREDANIPHLVPPVVHCVRHAQVRFPTEFPRDTHSHHAHLHQGYHNLSLANHAIRDPALTSYGEQQCRHLARTFPYHKTVDLLVASPLKRTLDTCLISFEPEVRAGMRIIALPEAQETGPVPCDTGLDPLPLKAAYKDMSVDFELVQDGWNSKTGKWSAESADIKARALEVRQWLKARPEKEIVLVTHGGFLHYLTEDWAGFNDWAGKRF